MRTKFGDNEDAPTNPEILIEAYSELAMVCSDVGEIKEAKKYNDRIGLLKKRLKKGDGKKEK